MKGEAKSTSVPERDKQVEEDLWQRYGAEREVWTEPMLIALERGIKGNKWFSLIDKVRSERTLGTAWEKVRANAGACGVDRISVEFFGKDSQSRLLAVKEHLRKNTYQPKAIRRVEIPKSGSKEKRPLGIPTVTDRVVQSAVKMVIEPIFEREFAPSSYGFRPGRGCKDALREVERLLRDGYLHVVDVDIRGYFDNIPHEALMELVKERLSDGKVLGLIEKFLRQGVMEEGIEIEPEKGSPQGGVISPLLANIYLNPLDWVLQELGIKSVRYADDIVLLAQSAEDARLALEALSGWVENARLALHPEKTRLVDMTKDRASFDFLGYRFLRTRKGKLIRLVRPKSKQKLRASLRRPTKRANGKSMEAIIAAINPVLEGWFAYFQQACLCEHQELDGWVRMRLRSILRKRHKGKGRGHGLDHVKWPNRYFEKLGLFSLVHAREDLMSLRRGANC
jgi:RNA-directed DNA polymerase